MKNFEHSLNFLFHVCVGGWEVCAKRDVRGINDWNLLVQDYLTQKKSCRAMAQITCCKWGIKCQRKFSISKCKVIVWENMSWEGRQCCEYIAMWSCFQLHFGEKLCWENRKGIFEGFSPIHLNCVCSSGHLRDVKTSKNTTLAWVTFMMKLTEWFIYGEKFKLSFCFVLRIQKECI